MLISDIKQHCFSSLLEVNFNNEDTQFIAFEILRIYSPHTQSKSENEQLPPLVTGKAFVKVLTLNFDDNGLSITFDDNHVSGLYSVQYLKQICDEQDTLWRDYLARLRYAKQLKSDAMMVLIND